MEQEVDIEKDWLTVENYEFKILVMIACLAENKRAYRGKMKDMCEFLGVSNATNNTKKIKTAIEELEAKGDIKVIRDGHTWTLTLSVKAERKPKIIKIQKAWIEAIKNYKAIEKKDSVAWENTLKVLVFLIADKRDIKKYDDIANDLLMSIDVVKRCIKALDGIELKDASIQRKLKWFKVNDDTYKPIGQEITVGHAWA